MPTPVTEWESSWSSTTSPKTSTALSVEVGDVLVVLAPGTSPLTVSDSAGLTWTLRQSITAANYNPVYLWTATVAAAGSLTVTVTRTGGSSAYGVDATVWRGVTVGASAQAYASGAPSLAITTATAGSAIVVMSSDWNGASGTSRTWRTGAGAATELAYEDVGSSTYYVAYHAAAGAAGAKTVGLSAPSGQKYSIVAVELQPVTTTRVTSALGVIRDAVGRITSTLEISRSALVTRVTSALGVSRQAVSRVQSSLAVSRSAGSFGTWDELIRTPQWLDAVAEHHRMLSARAELVDAQGTPQPIIIGGVTTTDLPLGGASVTFSGEQPEQHSATMAWTHPWMVPTTSAHPMWGARSLFVRLWWRIYTSGAWLEMPVCTVAIGDSSATDDGTISGTTRGRDVLSLLRGGYGAPLVVSGMTIDVALRAIFERCAPTIPVRISPTTVTVPDTLVLGEQDPLKDALDLAAIGYTDGTVRSDREGVAVCGPRPEPVSPELDWQEGDGCPVSSIEWAHGIEHMGNRITVSSTHADAVGMYVTVEDDDLSSPTYVGGPFGIRPLPGIETDKATTVEGLTSLGLMELGKGLHPVEDVSVTVPQRPDLSYRHPVQLGRTVLGVSSVYRVSSWGPLELPVDGEPPRPMKVGMMRRTVR